MAVPTRVIVGADRGIGRAITEQLHHAGHQVLAVTFGDGGELTGMGIPVAPGVDVTSDDLVGALAERIQGDAIAIEWLVHVSGIMFLDTIDTVDFDDVRRQFEVNTIGPLRVVRALRGALSAGSKVGVLTSRFGSITDNGSGGDYAYRISKAAANMVVVNLHHDLAKEGIAVQALHPGTVDTGLLDVMTPEDREAAKSVMVTPETAARNLIAVMEALTPDTSGQFQHATGQILPW